MSISLLVVLVASFSVVYLAFEYVVSFGAGVG